MDIGITNICNVFCIRSLYCFDNLFNDGNQSVNKILATINSINFVLNGTR
jgi:hypothetical protein